MTRRSATACVAVVLLGVYLLTVSGRFHGIDELAAHATLESLVREGRLSVEQFGWALDWTPTHVATAPDGSLYSKRGIGYSLAFLPFWSLGRLIDGVGLIQMSALTNVLVTVLAAVVLVQVALRLGATARWAAFIALLFGLTTPAWPYARFHYSEPLTTLCWVTAFWILVRSRDASIARPHAALLSGLVLGAGLLIHMINAIALLVVGVWWLWQSAQRERWWQEPLIFVAGALPSILLLAGLNWIRYDTLFTTGYTSPEERFVFDYAASLPGLLLSPGKGVIWFAPAVVPAVAGWRGFWREYRPAALLVAGWVAGALVVYGGWFMWWGGWSWGPRYLIPVLPLLLLPIVWYPRTRSALALLGVAGLAGFAINAMGVLVDFNVPLVDLAQRGLSDADVIWDWSAWPPLIHARFLLAGQIDVAWLAPQIDWPVLVLLAALTVAGLALYRRPRLAVLSAIALLLVTTVGLARHPWNEVDATFREVNTAVAAEGTPEDHVLVELVPYYDYFTTIQAWMNRYKAAPAYRTVVRGDAGSERIAPPDGAGRLWLVMERTPQGDPAAETEAALLDEMAFLDERWIGAFRVARLVPLPEVEPAAVSARFVNGVELQVTLEARGDLALVGLRWQPTQPLEANLKVFVQLVGRNGVVAQHDRVPHNGLLPTTAWPAGGTVREGYALPYTAGGDVIVGLYDENTGERVPLVGGGDFVTVGTLDEK